MAFPIIGAVALAALAFLAFSDKKTEGGAKPEVEPKEPWPPNEISPGGVTDLPGVPAMPLPQIPGMPSVPQPGVCLLDANIPPELAAEVNRALRVSLPGFARESWAAQLDAAASAIPLYPMAAGCLRARATELRNEPRK